MIELDEARGRLDLEREALAAQVEREREFEEVVRENALAEARRDRELEAWKPSGGRPRSTYEAWLDQHDAPRGDTSTENYSQNDRKALKVVEAGGGVEQIVDATGLLTAENVYRGVDSQILLRALGNDAHRRWHMLPELGGLRRLVPDPTLISRRAAGETLRRLGVEYGVSHTTLSRFFRRPEIAERVSAQKRRLASRRRPSFVLGPGLGYGGNLARIVAEMRGGPGQFHCSRHGDAPDVRFAAGPDGVDRLAMSFCCGDAKKEFELSLPPGR